MPNVNIVIPAYNNWNMTDTLLRQLLRLEKENISKILIVDDASTDEVLPGLTYWSENSEPKVSAFIQKENKGFLFSSNYGMSTIADYSDGEDIIILLSTDVSVNGMFIPQIVEILQENPKSLVGGVLYLHDTGWNSFGDRIFPYLEGWLLATTVSNWKELDYFDTRYAPCDFEDVDLSTKAIEKGYQLVPLNNIRLRHAGGASIGYSKKRFDHTTANKILFGEKWIK